MTGIWKASNVPEELMAALLEIVSEAAGKTHHQGGAVAGNLSDVLNAYDEYRKKLVQEMAAESFEERYDRLLGTDPDAPHRQVKEGRYTISGLRDDYGNPQPTVCCTQHPERYYDNFPFRGGLDDGDLDLVEILKWVEQHEKDFHRDPGNSHQWGGKKPIDAIRDFKQKAYQDRNKPTGLPDPRLTPGFDKLSPENQTELKKMFGIEEEDQERLTREFGLKVLEPGNHVCAVCLKPVKLRGEKWMHKVPIHGEIVLHDTTPRLYDIRDGGEETR